MFHTSTVIEALNCRQIIWSERYVAMTEQSFPAALPNGPKVVSGGNLSPRGDWRARSDANARVWLKELESGVPIENG